MSDKRKNVGAMVRDVAENDTEYIITRGGKAVAVVVPYERMVELREALVVHMEAEE